MLARLFAAVAAIACLIPVAGAACRSMLILTGLFSISCASVPIGPGIVALKNSVCRFFGTRARMRRMSGRKPMSSIRSASSSTRYSTWSRVA